MSDQGNRPAGRVLTDKELRSRRARNIAIGASDVVRIVDFAKHERLGLVILGPESAVDAGVGDALRNAGFNVFGPNRGAGRIESSKSFAKYSPIAPQGVSAQKKVASRCRRRGLMPVLRCQKPE